MLRLFFAVQPDAAQNALLVDRVAPLVARLGAQRVPAENLHATLCFIGAVPEEKLSLLTQVTGGVRGGAATLHFDALEYWHKPKVLCATADDDSQSSHMSELAERLGAATRDAGFAPDIKPFRAHLTLARKVHGAHAAQCEWPLPLTPPLSVLCDRFALMRSDRGASGSVYSVVESWPLDENAAR